MHLGQDIIREGLFDLVDVDGGASGLGSLNHFVRDGRNVSVHSYTVQEQRAGAVSVSVLHG